MVGENDLQLGRANHSIPDSCFFARLSVYFVTARGCVRGSSAGASAAQANVAQVVEQRTRNA